jgi:L-proline amide hydrolase
MIRLDRRALLASLAGAALGPRAAFGQPAWAPPPPDRELRVPVRGGRIYVRVNGDLAGPRAPVVFVHGGPGGNHAGFLPEVQLAGERGVILYDQLDSGLSDRPNDPSNWTVERFVSEVDALRAALNLKRFHLVGHSWGSTIALEYAARAPAGLLSATLGSPLISTRSWERSTTAQLAKLPSPAVREIMTDEAAGATDKDAYKLAMELFYSRYMATAPRPAYLRDYLAGRSLATNETLYLAMWGSGEIHGAGTLRTYDGEPLLPRIAAPALVLCGENDEMTADVLRPLVRRIPKADLVVIPGAGHALPLTHADAYMAALRPHFAAADGSTAVRYP